MHTRDTVVTLSVCLLCKISAHSPEHFFKNRSYFGKKASGTFAVIAAIYAGTAQSLNGLARELLACGILYQSCHSLHVVAGFAAITFFSGK